MRIVICTHTHTHIYIYIRMLTTSSEAATCRAVSRDTERRGRLGSAPCAKSCANISSALASSRSASACTGRPFAGTSGVAMRSQSREASQSPWNICVCMYVCMHMEICIDVCATVLRFVCMFVCMWKYTRGISLYVCMRGNVRR